MNIARLNFSHGDHEAERFCIKAKCFTAPGPCPHSGQRPRGVLNTFFGAYEVDRRTNSGRTSQSRSSWTRRREILVQRL